MSDFLTFNDASQHTVGQKVAFKAPLAMTLVEIVNFSINSAGTTGDTVFDIEINGASALNDYLAFVSGSTALYAPRTLVLTEVAKGDIITLDCDQKAGTGGFGFNLVLSYIPSVNAETDPTELAHDHRFGQPANDYNNFHDAN
jgi:hypothetical protein